ncbi:hypothetical protein BANRA_00031 [Escherichia coli]|uniref:Uncharacterized protein n=1 Tax=Escherichia coli TaxID=562 RepID=A0A3P5DJM5_ECOLX|nr:hypothetical protein BANRA_00031 [Escherichia coli]
MSKRTDTFLFVLIQKISSVGVQTGVVLYGCVTLLMTSFDVQQHHGHDISRQLVLSLRNKFSELGYARKLLVMWENLVEFGRIDLEAELLNRGVLNENGPPWRSVYMNLVPDSESKISFIILILIQFVWFD